MDRAPRRLYGKLVLMAVLWAGAFPATRILLEGMGVLTATFIRFWWAALVLVLLVIARDGALPRLAARDWVRVVALALVGVVAIASSGSTPSGADDVRPPSTVLVDTFVSLGMVLVIPAIALLLYGLAQRKAIAREIATGRYRRSGLVAFLAFMVIFTALFYYGLVNYESPAPPDAEEQIFPGQPPIVPEVADGTYAGVREPEFVWIPVLVVVGLAALAIAALVIATRRRRTPPAFDEETAAREVADDLDDGLDDLRAEPDPRRAVIAAYARLERALGVVGLRRDQGETSEEYVTRIFDQLEVDRTPVRRLGELFAYAKFSQHPVDEGMKHEAIAGLEQTRDGLRELARRRADERKLARASASGEVATS